MKKTESRIRGRRSIHSRREFLKVSTAALAAASWSVSPARSAIADPAEESNLISIPVSFTDVRERAGITWQQDGTDTAQKYYLETMGTGLGWIDYDQDGFLDLFLVQTAATDIYKPPHPLRSALYHNNGDGTFSDVTERAGVGSEGHYGQGVAVGDYDNDGYPDLYVTGYGSAILYHNNRDGTFTDVTAKAGVVDLGRWSTSAAWFDYNRDGYPQLMRNDGGNANHWLSVRLIGSQSNRDGIGSTLTLVAEGFAQVKQAKGGIGYQSAHDPRIHFGLDKRTQIDTLEIKWPSGAVTRLTTVPTDQIISVKEGSGIIPCRSPIALSYEEKCSG
jgi:ASPIC and UnbV/FG-GAP-like repeat